MTDLSQNRAALAIAKASAMTNRTACDAFGTPDLRQAMEGIVHFSDAVAYRNDPLSKALREWIEAGRVALANLPSASQEGGE